MKGFSQAALDLLEPWVDERRFVVVTRFSQAVLGQLEGWVVERRFVVVTLLMMQAEQQCQVVERRLAVVWRHFSEVIAWLTEAEQQVEGIRFWRVEFSPGC